MAHKYTFNTINYIKDVISNYFEDYKIEYSYYDNNVHPTMNGDTTFENFITDQSMSISFELLLKESQFTNNDEM